MAEFDVRMQERQPANFTNFSRGIDAAGNTALGNLFSNLANTLEGAVNEADRHIQHTIQEDIFDRVETIHDEFGVGDATRFSEPIEEEPRPAALEQAGENLVRLQQAYQQGALRESHYWARLNSMVRQLRGRYPGYRQEIDQMVARTVGARPANALRQALFREFGQAEDDPYQQLQDRIQRTIGLPPDFFIRQENGDPYSLTELQRWESDRQRLQWETKARRDALALEADTGQATVRSYERAFRKEANSFIMTSLQDSTSVIGKSHDVLMDLLTQARQRGRVSTEERQEILTAMNELKTAARDALHLMSAESWDGNPNHAYRTQLDTNTINQIIEGALLPISNLEQALSGDEPWGVLGFTSAWLESLKEEISRDFLENVPGSETLNALASLYGPDIAGMYLALTPEVQSAFEQSLIQFHSMRAAQGQGSVVEAFRAGQDADMSHQYYNSLIDRWTNLVDAVGADELGAQGVEILRNNVRFMFSRDSLALLAEMDDASRFEYFRRVASPAVTRAMLALREDGDFDSWRLYQTWVGSAFQRLFRQKVQDLNNFQNDALGMFDLEWNPKTLGFEFRTRVVGDFSLPAMELGRAGTNSINDAIRTLAPIIEANGGDPEREIMLMLEAMGYDDDRDHESSFLGKMWDALRTSSIALGFGAATIGTAIRRAGEL